MLLLILLCSASSRHAASEILTVINAKFMRVEIFKCFRHVLKFIIIEHRGKAEWSEKLVEYDILLILISIPSALLLVLLALSTHVWRRIDVYSKTSSTWWITHRDVDSIAILRLLSLLLIASECWKIDIVLDVSPEGRVVPKEALHEISCTYEWVSSSSTSWIGLIIRVYPYSWIALRILTLSLSKRTIILSPSHLFLLWNLRSILVIILSFRLNIIIP